MSFWFGLKILTLHAGPLYKWDQNFVIIASADVLAPNGARPSAGKMQNMKLHKTLM